MSVPITQQTVDKARRDAAAGRSYDVSDARTPGLVLRVGRAGAAWAFRAQRNGRGYRLRLGSVDLLNLTVARDLAGAAMVQLRETPYPPDEAWLRSQLVARKIVREPPRPAAELTAPNTWTFGEARTAYLSEVARTRRETTHRDRKAMLGLPELRPLEGRPVGLIRRQDLAEIVAGIHRSGRERHAEHLVECLRPMWSWLAADAQQLRSGVLSRDMRELRAPERSHKDEDEDGQGSYVPPPAELGRILAIARAGVLHPTLAAAVELLLATCQRRRTIVSARRADFVDEDGQLVWRIPPRHRKTARRLGSRRTHDLPLVGRTAELIRVRLAGDESEWLFPATRPRKAGRPVTHLAPDSLTHALAGLPGVTATPHDVRRGLTTHGQDVLGLDDDEIKLVLDHAEGRGSRDVTEGSYSKARRLDRKRAVLEPWVDLVEREAAKIEVDVQAVRAAITATRRKAERKKEAA